MLGQIQKTYFVLIIILIVTSCRTETKIRVNKTNHLLSNGSTIFVEKTNEDKTSIGMFSHHDYGTSHYFSYRFSVDPGSINWEGGSREPKGILFCKNDVYLYSLKEVEIHVFIKDSTDSIVDVNSHYETQEVFEQYIDKRYFFKLLGDDYWIDVSLEDYQLKKKNYQEFAIPNDNEIKLSNKEG